MINKIKLTKDEEHYIYAHADNDEDTADEANTIINGTKYFFKGADHDTMHAEFIVEKLAKLVGINCVHYDYAIAMGHPFYLSENIAKNGHFYCATFEELYYPMPTTLFECKKRFEERKFNNINKLMDQLINVYMFDIILGISDRHNGNFGVLKDNDIEELYILDNCGAFADWQSSHFLFNFYVQDYNMKRLNFLDENLKDLKIFIDQSDKRYFDEFKRMFGILTPERIKEVIESVETELNEENIHKEMILEYVSNLRQKIESFISSNLKNNISTDDEDYIYKKKRGSIRIGDKNYYFKYHLSSFENHEIIMERLAEHINLNHAHYLILTINGCPFYLSEDLSNDALFKTAYELGIQNKFYENGFSLYDIWQKLEKLYPDKVSDLMNDVIKMYLFDLFVGNTDRVGVNWGIQEKNGVVKLCIFDNELSFYGFLPNTITSKFSPRGDYTNSTKSLEDNYEELKYFIKTSDHSTLEFCKEIFMKFKKADLFGLKGFYELITGIENDHECIVKDKKIYDENIFKIYDILEEGENKNEARILSC